MTSTKLRRSGPIHLTVGLLAYSLGQWLVLVVLARSTTPAFVGEYGLALAVLSPLVLLFSFGLRTLYVTDVAGGIAYRRFANARYLGLLALAVSASGLAVGTGTFSLVFATVMTSKLVDMLADLWLGISQAFTRTAHMGAYWLVNGVSTPLFVIALSRFGGHAAVSGTLIGSLAAAVLLIMFPEVKRTLRERVPDDPRSGSLSLWKAGLALAIASCMTSLGTNAPRLGLGFWASESAVGVFSALQYFAIAGSAVASAISQHFLRSLAVMYQEGHRYGIRRYVYRWTLGVAVLYVFGLAFIIMFGEAVLVTLYGTAYNEVFVLILIFTGWCLSTATWCLDTVLASARQFRALLVCSLGASVVGVIASIYFAFHYGLVGGALAALIHGVALSALRLHFARSTRIS